MNDDKTIKPVETMYGELEVAHSHSGRSFVFENSHTVDLYLAQLDSAASRLTMKRVCSALANFLGKSNYASVTFEKLKPHGVTNLRSKIVGHKIKIPKKNPDAKQRYREISPSTVNLYLSALRGVLKTALEYDRIDPGKYQRLLVNIKKIRGSRSIKGKALKEADVSLLFNALSSQDVKSIRDHAIVCVMVGCGLRRDEVANLELNHYSQSENELRIIGKGNKEREVACNKVVTKALTAWIEGVRGDEPGPLFLRLRKNGDVLEAGILGNGIYFILKKYAENLGITDLKPHNLRRTFATNLYAKGADITIISELLGHANTETTRLYLKVDTKDAKKKTVALLE